jgi:dipeptidyl aminopeptidase/acylaminoacyl peptidase
MKAAAALLSLLLAAALSAQPKQPLTHESMWLMPRVGAPAVSPDGKWVVFSVTQPAYDEKEQTSDLWAAPADGSAKPRQITFSKPGESDVTWSPDSKRIAFSAKREGDETNQLYILDLASGGEAQRVTTLSTGARTPQFRPDGKALLFSSVVYPGAADDEANKKIAKERKDQKYKVRAFDSFPVRNWDRWLDDTQVHLIVQPTEAGAKAKDLLSGTKLVAEAGFAGRTTEGSRDEIDAAWSPDGSSIVFAATTKRNTAAYQEVGTDLYRISSTGGEPEVIAHADGSYSRPRFSPDGKTLYVVFNANNLKLYNNDNLVAYDWPSMQNRRVLTASLDRSVNSFAPSPDGKTIWFTAEDAGLEKIYSVPAAGGDAKLAVDAASGTYTDLVIPTKASSLMLIGRWGSSVNPAEVVSIDPVTKARRNITDFNVAKAAQIDWQPPRHFWFTSTRGRKLHNMLFVPAGFDETKKYPLLVLLHGGPAGAWRDSISLRWNYHLLANLGPYVIVTTDYVGSTGYGEKFAQDIQGDPFKGPADEINEGADEAIKRFPFIDASRQAAAGASYGGHLANWLQASTTRYKALISHAGLVNSEAQYGTSDTIYSRELMNRGPVWEQGPVWKEQNPIRYAKNFKTPILLSVGERDFRVPLNNTLENWSILQRLQVPSRLLVWPDENHWILNAENSRRWYGEVKDWLARWVKWRSAIGDQENRGGRRSLA